jgi:hypothetical protein
MSPHDQHEESGGGLPGPLSSKRLAAGRRTQFAGDLGPVHLDSFAHPDNT